MIAARAVIAAAGLAGGTACGTLLALPDPPSGSCGAGDDCASGVCLPGGCDAPTGTCADSSTILHAADSGQGDLCSRAQPCSLTTALGATSKARPIVSLARGTYVLPGLGIPPLAGGVVLSGDAATLQLASPLVVDRATVTLIGLTIESIAMPPAVSLHGATCSDSTLVLHRAQIASFPVDGIIATGCVLRLSASAISNNRRRGISASGGTTEICRTSIVGNEIGGVVQFDGELQIVNGMIVRNGSSTGLTTEVTGGVFLNGAVVYRIDHSTIASNTTPPPAEDAHNPSVECTTNTAGLAPIGQITSSIAWFNRVALSTPSADVVPGCPVAYSLLGGAATAGQSHDNVIGDPQFCSPTDFHLRAISRARNLGDPTSNLAIDFDGDPRSPRPDRSDVGADEVSDVDRCAL